MGTTIDRGREEIYLYKSDDIGKEIVLLKKGCNVTYTWKNRTTCP